MKQENNCALPQEGAFRTTIGGQALIEGILMRGPEKQAIVVRNQEGELEVKEQTLKLIKDRYPILGLPFLRGVVNFLASLVEGVKALMWSAEFYPDEEEEKPPSKFETWLEKHFGSEGLMKWVIGFSVVVGIAFAIALFIILPTLATSALLYFFPDAPMWLRNLLEGVLKLVIFFLYLFLCSRLRPLHFSRSNFRLCLFLFLCRRLCSFLYFLFCLLNLVCSAGRLSCDYQKSQSQHACLFSIHVTFSSLPLHPTFSSVQYAYFTWYFCSFFHVLSL